METMERSSLLGLTIGGRLQNVATRGLHPNYPAMEGNRPSGSRPSTAFGRPSRSQLARAAALSELLSKGAEEIQDHLSLVARIQIQIGRLLATSIDELERAERLEALTSFVTEGEPDGKIPRRERDSLDSRLKAKAGAYLEQEIRTLKKMQRLLGVPAWNAGASGTPAAGESRAQVPDEGRSDSSSARKVLIIMPDPGTMRVLKYFLEKEGCEVLTCSEGPAGVRAAVREMPQVILLDILLPGTDGYQILGQLKENDRTARIPVFVLSVLAQEADVVRAVNGGAADYFAKPFSPQILLAKIRQVLRARHE